MTDAAGQAALKTAPAVRNWTLETDASDVAWLGLRTTGNSSTNVLSRQVLLELDVVLDALVAAPPAGLVIFSHKDGCFVAGADVHEFPQFVSVESASEQVGAGQAVFNRLASLPFATVAVLNGLALGGGMELALACNWRLSFAAERATIGFPEVQLGLHPGLGGTVRCPRLIGVRSAMQLMLTGKPVTPDRALQIGLIDCLCEPGTVR